MILTRSGHSFGSLFVTKTKMSEKHTALATNDNSFHNKTGWHTLAPIQQYPSVVAGLGEAIWVAQRSRSEPRQNVEHHPEMVSTIIPDAGHWVMYEKGDEFNEALASMLVD